MAWSFLSAHIEQWDGNSFTTDSWTMASGSTRILQAYFKISGTSFGDPVAAGEIEFQVDYGSGWIGFTALAKNVVPDRIVGLASLQGDRVERVYQSPPSQDGTFSIRAEVNWTGGPYYSNTLTFTLDSAAFMEIPGPPGTHTEQDPPSGSWTEQSAPSQPAGGYTEQTITGTTWAEKTPTAAVFSEQDDSLSQGFSEKDAPAVPTGDWGEQEPGAAVFSEKDDPPAQGFSEKDDPPAGGDFTEQEPDAVSWTEGTP